MMKTGDFLSYFVDQIVAYATIYHRNDRTLKFWKRREIYKLRTDHFFHN